jgi:small-conductance mechanosensitive channel
MSLNKRNFLFIGSVVVVIVAGVVWATDKKRKAAQTANGRDLMPWKLILYLDPVLTLIMIILICISTIPLGLTAIWQTYFDWVYCH